MTSNLQIKVKFSDLTVDSFRFLQLLEYDATFCKLTQQALMNPHKYILYKPTFTQIATYLSVGIQVSALSKHLLQAWFHITRSCPLMVWCSCIYHPMVILQLSSVLPWCHSNAVVNSWLLLIEFGLHISGGVRTARPGSSDKARPAHEPHWYVSVFNTPVLQFISRGFAAHNQKAIVCDHRQWQQYCF